MSYITQADLTKHFSVQEVMDLTDRDNEGEINADILTDGIDRAESEVNSYLSARYSVPLDSPDAYLKQIVMDIWRFRMSDNHVTEQIRERYTDAIKWLTKVSAGKIAITGSAVKDSAVTLPFSVSLERG